MKILLLTFYFQPDLSAGSFRSTSLANALAQKLGPNDHIDIITSQPNRYATYQQAAAPSESIGNIRITRIKLPPHKSGMKDQIRSYLTFYRKALELCRGQHYDVVYATSSRLMTAFLGARISQKISAPLYLDIRDIFVDTLTDLFDKKPHRLMLPVLKAIERFTLKRARKVNLVSAGFIQYFKDKYPLLQYETYTNGIDPEFLQPWTASARPQSPSPLSTVLYAGNIGEGQGLDHILPDLAKKTESSYRFIVVGDGGMRERLEQRIKELGVHTIELVSPMPRHELIQLYNQADILFLHLNDYPAFRKVLPSKIFEYAAMGKPILAGVAGYSSCFLTEEVPWAVGFKPCDLSGALHALATTRAPTHQEQADFCFKFNRQHISEQLADSILMVATGRSL